MVAWKASRRQRGAAVAAALLIVATQLMDVPLVSAQHRWPDERQAEQFLCHADFSLSSRLPLLAELAALQHDLGQVLGAAPPREFIHLFLFKEKTTYQDYLKQYFPRVPYRRALFIKARGPGMVFAFAGPDLEIDVRHECTHALLHAWLTGDVPLWLDEGLAEYFEVARHERASEHPHHQLVRVAYEAGQPPRLEALEALSKVEEMGREEYRDAWALIHFLLHGPPPAREELLSYLRMLHKNEATEPLSLRLRRRIPDFDRQLAGHFDRPPGDFLRQTR